MVIIHFAGGEFWVVKRGIITRRTCPTEGFWRSKPVMGSKILYVHIFVYIYIYILLIVRQTQHYRVGIISKIGHGPLPVDILLRRVCRDKQALRGEQVERAPPE